MAAATTVSSLFTDSTTPKFGRPKATERGHQIDRISHVIPTTMLNDIGDRIMLIPVPLGVEIIRLGLECGDLDTNGSPLLDADLVLSNGVAASDVILYNAGTAFQAALGITFVHPFAKLAQSTREFLSIDFYVNAVAATAAQGTLKLVAEWHRTET